MENIMDRIDGARQNMYHFLSRLFLLEADRVFYEHLKSMRMPVQCKHEDMASGFALIKKWLNEHSYRDLEWLATDYARVFLAAGIADGMAAFPYESVYTGKKHLIMQEPAGEMDRLYAQKGLKLNETLYKVPGDHIGLQLEYMAQLCTEGCGSREIQKDFFFRHLNNWVPVFCSEIGKYSETDFYRGLAKLTRGFIDMEAQLLKGGIYGLLSE